MVSKTKQQLNELVVYIPPVLRTSTNIAIILSMHTVVREYIVSTCVYEICIL